MYAVFLDASKAFDKVEHVKLFSELLNRGICPVVVRYLFVSYQVSKLAVKWEESVSSFFPQGNGVKQGAVLSPILFAIYIDPLIKRLRDSRVGCHIGRTASNVFGYADDLVLLAPTVTAVNRLLKICEEFSEEFNLTFNPSKSSLLTFHPPGMKEEYTNILFLGKPIPTNYTEKHLGHLLSTSRKSVDFCDIIRDVKIKTNVILKEFSHLNTWSKVKLFNSQCLSLYGCELWDLSDQNIKKICCEWRKCSRQILGISPRTHNFLIPQLMSTPDLLSTIYSRILSFCNRGLSHPSEEIRFLFENFVYNPGSSFANNIKTICNKLGVSRNTAFTLKATKVKSMCNKLGINEGAGNISRSISELIDIRDGQLHCNLNYYETTECLTALCTG